ncbi:MAG: TIGR01906 family membrane protein [Clostridia bacterium]
MFFYTILFSFIQFSANDSAWFEAEYYKLDTSRQIGMSNTDINKAMKALIDYMEGRTNDLEKVKVKINGDSVRMYNNKDIDHMKDVKVLYQNCRMFRNIAAVSLIVLLVAVFLTMKRDALIILSKSFIWAFSAMAVILGAILIFAAIDFDAFWTFFHTLVFDNELWLIDPSKSYLIWICPSTLFYDIITRFLIYSGIVFVAFLGGAITYLAVRRHNHNTPVLRKKGEK